MSQFDIEYQIHIIRVPALGWLPTLQDGRGKETYRGEYQNSLEEAMERCAARITSAGKAAIALGLAS